MPLFSISWSSLRDFISVRFFFSFKQKTAYEMRISDWSSDVCSSDLGEQGIDIGIVECGERDDAARQLARIAHRLKPFGFGDRRRCIGQIGRASRRERVCQYV